MNTTSAAIMAGDGFSVSTKRRNPHLFNKMTVTSRAIVRQSHKQPTKLHRDFGEYLRQTFPWASVREEDVTLKIANGVRYTPDWVVIDMERAEPDERFVCYECKGFMRDDAAVKIKLAPTIHPWAKFFLVTREDGKWKIQQVLP